MTTSRRAPDPAGRFPRPRYSTRRPRRGRRAPDHERSDPIAADPPRERLFGEPSEDTRIVHVVARGAHPKPRRPRAKPEARKDPRSLASTLGRALRLERRPAVRERERELGMRLADAPVAEISIHLANLREDVVRLSIEPQARAPWRARKRKLVAPRWWEHARPARTKRAPGLLVARAIARSLAHGEKTDRDVDHDERARMRAKNVDETRVTFDALARRCDPSAWGAVDPDRLDAIISCGAPPWRPWPPGRSWRPRRPWDRCPAGNTPRTRASARSRPRVRA